MSRIETISPKSADGELKEIYQTIKSSRGEVANVLTLHSLMPQTLEDHYNLYKTLMFKSRFTGLSRKLLEMIAVIVSSTNECNYCIEHHSLPLSELVKDETLLKAIKIRDWYTLVRELDEKELIVLFLAEKIAKSPNKKSKNEIDEMKTAGYTDQQILHIILVINYFNFVNRNVLALDIQLENNFPEKDQ